MPSAITLIRKMYSTYEDWKKSREQRGRPRPASLRRDSVSGRVGTAPLPEGTATDGVLSFSQMQRLQQARQGRPVSEVGSIRSVRSVATVEEQVTQLESQVQALADTLKVTQEQQEKTNALLLELLKKVSEPASKK